MSSGRSPCCTQDSAKHTRGGTAGERGRWGRLDLSRRHERVDADIALREGDLLLAEQRVTEHDGCPQGPELGHRCGEAFFELLDGLGPHSRVLRIPG